MLQVLHELWDFVNGGHPCPTDTFLVDILFKPRLTVFVCLTKLAET